MKKVAFVLFLTCCITVMAQNPHLEYRAAVKIYNISTLQIMKNQVYFGTYDRPSYTLQIMHPALAIQWQNRKRNFHEVELTRLLINKNYSTYDVSFPGGGFERSGSRNVANAALRYEYILCFAKKRDRRLLASLGLGLVSSFYRQSFDPDSPALFYLSTTNAAFDGQVAPRLNYHLNSRFYLDLNIPVSAVRLSMNTSTNRNPQIPAQQQKYSYSDFSLLPSLYRLRLGLGFKI